MRKPKLVFVNRFFYPDHSATSQILSDLVFYLANRGWDVHVIASRMLYDDPSAWLASREVISGVSVHRVKTARFGRRNLLGRALDYLTFYPTAMWRLWRIAQSGDVVVIKTDPPLMAVPAGIVCSLRGSRSVQWVQDLFPEVAAAHNIRLARGIPGAILKFLRNWAYWASAACAVLGQVMAERLNRQGIPSERTRVLPNWSDGEDIRPLAHSDNPLRLEWGLIESFVVGYSGNLGRAHDIHTMLGAAREMEGQCPDVTFLLVGGGAQRPWVEQRVYEQGMTNMHLKPYQPWERLSESLCAADIHLVSLRPEMEGLIFPSKLYGVLAAGRPVVFIGDPHGEAARLIRDTNCGVAVAQGDSAGLTQVIRELRADPERVLAMGRRARNLFESRFDRNQALPAWEELLAEVAENR